MRDDSSNIIEKIEVEIYKGTGMAAGASGIAIKLCPESAAPIETGLWKIEKNRIVPSGGEISANEATVLGQLQNALDSYFTSHSEELENLKKQLQSN